MADDLIPEEIKHFILGKIESVAQLEGLLLLRSNPEPVWDVESVAKRLYISQSQASEVLEHLCAQRLLTATQDVSTSYRFQPETQNLQQMVDRVAEVYSKYLVAVTNLIHSSSKTRVQEFADAFKLRKRED